MADDKNTKSISWSDLESKTRQIRHGNSKSNQLADVAFSHLSQFQVNSKSISSQSHVNEMKPILNNVWLIKRRLSQSRPRFHQLDARGWGRGGEECLSWRIKVPVAIEPEDPGARIDGRAWFISSTPFLLLLLLLPPGRQSKLTSGQDPRRGATRGGTRESTCSSYRSLEMPKDPLNIPPSLPLSPPRPQRSLWKFNR